MAQSSKGKLDYRIGRRAFMDGLDRKAIALMLASESAAVQQVYRSDGKQRAIRYVNQMAHRICQQPEIKNLMQQSPPPKRYC
ncbi:MAG: hypothetical protein WA885_13155 [Phormidesmis sp.]